MLAAQPCGDVYHIRRSAGREGGLFVIRPVFRRRQRSFQCPSVAHTRQPPKLLDDPCMNGEHFMGTEEKQSDLLYSGPCASWV